MRQRTHEDLQKARQMMVDYAAKTRGYNRNNCTVHIRRGQMGDGYTGTVSVWDYKDPLIFHSQGKRSPRRPIGTVQSAHTVNSEHALAELQRVRKQMKLYIDPDFQGVTELTSP